MSSEGFTVQQALNKLANEGIILISKTIGSPTFTGSGLDDMSNGGEFTGDVDVEYEVEIDLAAGTDTFKWSKGVPGATLVEQASSVAITGSAQTLDNGVTVTFNATTGHTLADKWTFTARAADPAAVIKTIADATTQSLAPSGTQTIGPFDLRNVSALALTIQTGFAVGATDGISVKAFTSADNIDYDVDPYASTGLEPTFVANTTAQKTSIIDTPVRFIKFLITNLDGVKSTTGMPGYITKLER